MKNSEIRIRDPFVLTDAENGRYYLYGTTDPEPWSGKGCGFQAYTGTDLENWEGPYDVFVPSGDFWGETQFWAPEVHRYAGAYYMFATFNSEHRNRGVQILRAEAPLGPFVPVVNDACTPAEWLCLDGTLYTDEAGDPWMVFCHEWVQIHDGGMCAMRLKRDLSGAAGEPVTLFHASESGWNISNAGRYEAEEKRDYVTDGPFLYRSEQGELWMVWSGFAETGYAVGLAKSTTGSILGPWRHVPQPVYGQNGGHCMLFRTPDGRLKMALHTPNDSPNERPVFFSVTEKDGTLQVEKNS